jgi:hypothetical protein
LNIKKHIITGIATLWVAISFSFPPQLNCKLQINFENYVGDELLKLDSVSYKNELEQNFTVHNFKYYISNIHLKRTDGKEFVSSNSYLINEEEPQSKQIMLNNVPEGSYSEISFIIGVDSLHNCSGAQSGALDPVNAMFWSWNTGYIFMKLEGTSPLSKSPGNLYEFHIGGYRTPYNCIRKVSLNTEITITKDQTSSMKIKVDASEVMKTPTTIDLSKLSSVTDFHNATLIADNYSDMFSIIK